MKYAVWFVRLVFAAWMIPAGLNHFVYLFPQPMGDRPLSTELITALLDSHMFVITKMVELLAGLCVLFGFYTPLALVLCLPVSFCVWFWDVPLQGWGSISAIYGWAVLLSNLFLCLAHFEYYRPMFAVRSAPGSLGTVPPLAQQAGGRGMKTFVLAARVVFGAWMLASGLNHFVLPLWPEPAGTQPLAAELMKALNDSRLIDVTYAIQLIAGALILTGFFVPFALCAVMPVSVGAAFWTVILEHQPLGAALGLLAVVLNALLLFAYIDYYHGMLQRHSLSYGES